MALECTLLLGVLWVETVKLVTMKLANRIKKIKRLTNSLYHKDHVIRYMISDKLTSAIEEKLKTTINNKGFRSFNCIDCYVDGDDYKYVISHMDGEATFILSLSEPKVKVEVSIHSNVFFQLFTELAAEAVRECWIDLNS